MQFDYEGDEYDISFYYEWVESTSTKRPVKQTRCTIAWVDPNLVGRDRYSRVVSTCAIQHVRDQFCRSKGRKVALKKAIDLFMFYQVDHAHGTKANKIVRRHIWDAYFEACDKRVLTVNKKDFKEMLYKQKALKEADAWV